MTFPIKRSYTNACRFSALVLAAAFAGGLASGAMPSVSLAAEQDAASAETDHVHSFDIPAQALSEALRAFGRQSGYQISVATGATEGLSSQAVQGRLSISEALDRLLARSSLQWRFSGERTIALETADSASASELGTVVVQSTAETATSPVDGYVAHRSGTATKSDVPLSETPRSVSIVTADEVEDRGARTVVDAVEYSAGVNTGTYGFDPRFDQIQIRGFSVTTAGDYRDGLRQPYAAYGTFRTDPYNLERIEVLKGPASSLYGTGSVGGMVNRISKRPTQQARKEVRARYLTDDRKEGAIDISGPATKEGEHLYRIVGLARRGRSNFEIQDDRKMLAPTYTWLPSSDTSLTLIGLVQQDETDSSVTALNRNDRVFEIRSSDPDYDYQKLDQYQIGYELEHHFNDTFRFAQNLRYGEFDLDARYLSGSAAGGGWSGDTYRRGATAIVEDLESVQVDNRLTTSASTGPVEHELLTGLDYQDVESHFGLGSTAAQARYDLDLNTLEYGIDGPTPAITSRTFRATRCVRARPDEYRRLSDHCRLA
jgi:iron complex outermembrane receptor protein